MNGRRLRPLFPLVLVATLVAALAAPASAAPMPAEERSALQVTVSPPDEGKATPTADKPSPESVKAVIDVDLGDLLSKLTGFEVDYFKTNGRFYQALDSHTTPPADGALDSPDKLSAGPTDQTEKAAYLWQQLTLDAALPYSVRVDVYEGPGGWGYAVTVSATLNGEVWARTVNTGPEAYRESAWRLVVPPERTQ